MNITNMEMAQATIEIFGGLACLIAMLIVVINGYRKPSLSLIKWMFLSMSGLFFIEAAAYIFRGNVNTLSLFMTRACNLAVFLINYIMVGLYVRFVYRLIEEKGGKPGGYLKKVVNISIAAITVLLFVNLFTGWMYYFDEQNYYHRNVLWYVYTFGSLLLIVAGACLGLKYRAYISRRKLAMIWVYALTPIIMIIEQLFYYGISLTNIGIASSLVFLLIVYLWDWHKTETEELEQAERYKKNIGIALLYFIMVISMSAAIGSCIVSIDRISQDNSKSASRIIAHMVADSIDAVCLRPITVAETMASDYSLHELLKESGEMSAESIEERMAAYINAIRVGFDYQMVFVAGEKSQAYFTYDGISRYLNPAAHDIWYTDFQKKGKKYDLNVDTDVDNYDQLAVFVNTDVRDENQEFLGVCGVGVDMSQLQELIADYERAYNIQIKLMNHDGLVQLSSDPECIECEYLKVDCLSQVGSSEFYYEDQGATSCLTKYMKNLDWYLVIEDLNPNKIDVRQITTPSIFIFFVGVIIMMLVFWVMSMSEQKASKELLERKHASITDEMTGMYNRRAYEEDCDRLERADVLLDTVIVMMDINGLKTANDTLGHAAGDELIIGAANCMQTTFSEYGRIYRTGGDEFVALLQCTREEAEDALRTFDHRTAQWHGEHVAELVISKGVVICCDYPDMPIEELQAEADKRMYADKDAYYARTGKKRRKGK